MDALIRTVTLIRKELLAILKDPRSRVTIIVPPIMQCLIFGYAATYDLNHVPYAVLDHDRSDSSRMLLARFDGSGIFTRAATLQRTGAVENVINSRQVMLAIVIDHDFERNLHSGMPASIQVIADGRNSNTANISLGYVNAIVSDFNQRWQADRGAGGPGIEIVTRAWFNPSLETRWNMVPALIATISMMMTLMLTAMSVAREREEGTFDQLLVAPYHPSEIMIGKAVPSMIVGVTQASLILLVSQLWFQIPFAGSYAILFLGLCLFLAAAIGIGLFVSSLVANMQQAMILSFVLLMPFMLLSGLTAPIGNMPRPLQYLTMINPLRYAISIARKVYLEGAGIAQLAPEMVALIAIAVVTLPISAWMFRNRLG